MNTYITHAAIYTADLERSRDFYCKYFGGVSNEKYADSDGFSSYFITFSSGARLELMSHTELESLIPRDRVTGYSHLAFSVGSRENVVALTNRLIADGYAQYLPARDTGDGYFESCMADPDGNRVEITV